SSCSPDRARLHAPAREGSTSPRTYTTFMDVNAACSRCGHGTGDFVCETCAVEVVDAAAKRRTRRGLALAGTGVVLFVILGLMYAFKVDVGGNSHDEEDMSLSMYVFFGACAFLGVGIGMLSYRPKLKL